MIGFDTDAGVESVIARNQEISGRRPPLPTHNRSSQYSRTPVRPIDDPRGRWAPRAGLVAIQSQRTAALSAPLITACTCRTVDAAIGLHTCGAPLGEPTAVAAHTASAQLCGERVQRPRGQLRDGHRPERRVDGCVRCSRRSRRGCCLPPRRSEATRRACSPASRCSARKLCVPGAREDRSVHGPWIAADGRTERDTAGPTRERPLTMFPLVRGRSPRVWQVKDSNLRRLSRRIYSPLPLATRATCRGAP